MPRSRRRTYSGYCPAVRGPQSSASPSRPCAEVRRAVALGGSKGPPRRARTRPPGRSPGAPGLRWRRPADRDPRRSCGLRGCGRPRPLGGPAPPRGCGRVVLLCRGDLRPLASPSRSVRPWCCAARLARSDPWVPPRRACHANSPTARPSQVLFIRGSSAVRCPRTRFPRRLPRRHRGSPGSGHGVRTGRVRGPPTRRRRVHTRTAPGGRWAPSGRHGREAPGVPRRPPTRARAVRRGRPPRRTP